MSLISIYINKQKSQKRWNLLNILNVEHQKYLEDTNEAIKQNQRAQAAMYIVKYAKDNEQDITAVTENIGEHLSDPEWQVPEHMKPALVQQATKFVEGNVGRFLARDKTFGELRAAIHSSSQGQDNVLIKLSSKIRSVFLIRKLTFII